MPGCDPSDVSRLIGTRGDDGLCLFFDISSAAFSLMLSLASIQAFVGGTSCWDRLLYG